MRPIRVGDLITYLGKFSEDLIVIQSKDPEGNGFSSLDECTEMYVDKSYDGGMLDEEVWDTEDLTGSHEPDEHDEILENFQKVLVIWPE